MWITLDRSLCEYCVTVSFMNHSAHYSHAHTAHQDCCTAGLFELDPCLLYTWVYYSSFNDLKWIATTVREAVPFMFFLIQSRLKHRLEKRSKDEAKRNVS